MAPPCSSLDTGRVAKFVVSVTNSEMFLFSFSNNYFWTKVKIELLLTDRMSLEVLRTDRMSVEVLLTKRMSLELLLTDKILEMS